MAISPYLRELRMRVGSDLVLLPAVCVLVWDEAGRLLLMQEAQTRRWQTIGGMIDPDEAPDDAARREAREETGANVRLTGLRAALGGPGYRVRYPNGDLCSYVSIVFDAEIDTTDVSDTIDIDDDEVHALGWFHTGEIAALDLDDLNRCLLGDLGLLGAAG